MKSASEKNNGIRPQVREPQQKRAIEKKEKIIQACMELVSEKGYRSTTTVDIAKKAGVSTGIVYSYFKDKKDILLSALYLMFDQMCDPLFELLSSYDNNDDLL
ncbi:MAG: TetR/AcrR family transcriptional regulator, partial [Lachnospiraceae bacterium]